jgi:precorrin-4/cobalt-precorrin-4 C11-methyltransferase
MIVHFIGAGPGASDLLTLRGQKLIRQSPVCLYAGSLIPEAILEHCGPDARVVNTADLTLDEIIAEIVSAHQQDQDVARLHSGDLSIWSAMAEQMRRLDALGIAYDVTPGVPAFAAAAAALRQELTLPGVAQTLILTRTATRSTPMPIQENLETLCQSGATLALHLSIANLESVVAQVTPFYGADCPAVVVYRASWPDERIIRSTLAGILQQVQDAGIDRNALILIGKSLTPQVEIESYLYSGKRER